MGGNVNLFFLPSSMLISYFCASHRCYAIFPQLVFLALMKIFLCVDSVQIDVLGSGR